MIKNKIPHGFSSRLYLNRRLLSSSLNLEFRLFFFLALFSFNVQSQTLKSLQVKRKYTSESEVAQVHPEFTKKISVTNKSIQILNQGDIKREVKKSGIPSNLNSIVFSPNDEYFVAFEEAENETDFIYFFRSDGTMLSKQMVKIYPNVKFSKNSEHVLVFNNYGREIFLFTKTGLLVFSGDYIDLINDKSKILYNVLVSDDGNDFLINAGDDAHLLNIKNRSVKYKIPVGRVVDGVFDTDKNKIAIKTISEQSNAVDLKILSRANGKLLDKIEKTSRVEFVLNGVVVFKDSSVIEYVYK
jgi:hypothetical protein